MKSKNLFYPNHLAMFFLKIVKLTYLESLCMNGFLAAKITGFCLRYLLTNIEKKLSLHGTIERK